MSFLTGAESGESWQSGLWRSSLDPIRPGLGSLRSRRRELTCSRALSPRARRHLRQTGQSGRFKTSSPNGSE